MRAESASLKKDVEKVVVPKFAELCKKNIFKNVLPNALFESYLPSKTREVYRINESFILAILKKVKPDYFAKILEDA